MDLRINKLSYKAEKIDFVKQLPPLEPSKHEGDYLTADVYLKIMKKLPRGRISRMEKCNNCPD